MTVGVPNLILLGAPKCGTSSLYDWLVSHPEIAGCGRKETFYMVDDDNPLRYKDANFGDHGLAGYERLFSGVTAPVRIDATTHYIYQDTALRVLGSMSGPPHFVALVRRPADRVLSSFNYTKHNRGRVDPAFSFAEYVDALLHRRPQDFEGRVFHAPSFWVLARELEYSRYADYLARWMKAVPPARLHVYPVERLRASPLAVLTEVCAAVGVDAAPFDGFDFRDRNETGGVRWPRLHRWAMAAARRFSGGDLRRSVKRVYAGLQRGGRLPISDADRDALRRLDEYFEPSVRVLESILGLDLSAWRIDRSGNARSRS